MKIALVTFEFPPGKNVGGIGTYFFQLSRGLCEKGNSVFVFTSSLDIDSVVTEVDNLTIVRIVENSRINFATTVLPYFKYWNEKISHFDVIEGPEYNADTREIKRIFPHIPLVLKLHTPTFWVSFLNRFNPPLHVKLRFLIAGFLRGQIPRRYWNYQFSLERYLKEDDIEYKHALEADLLSSPCKSLASIIQQYWGIDNNFIEIIANPLRIDSKFNSINSINTSNITISFIGRLEFRKGILLLLDVIPSIVKKYPSVIFNFVGAADPSPIPSILMDKYIQRGLKNFNSNLRFTGRINLEQLIDELNSTSICIFPSIWENFPNVCLEAMSAGKAIIASKNGGMSEMIEHNVSGLLIDPKNTLEMSNALTYLISSEAERDRLGRNARLRVADAFNYDVIISQQMQIYKQAIDKCINK